MKQFLIAGMCFLMLSACASPGNTQPEQTAAGVSPVSTPTPPAARETTADLVSFTAYRGNDNADGLFSREVLVPEITPELVLSALVEDGVVSADVFVLTLTRKGQQLFIDFNNAFSQCLRSMGSAGETMLMNSVVNTFLSAYDAQSVLITVEGGIPESGHAVYDFPLTYQD